MSKHTATLLPESTRLLSLRREVHRHAREPCPVLQYLPAMVELAIVGLLARGIDGGIDRVEHPANENWAIDRPRTGAIEHGGQVVKSKAGPGRREIEEEFDAGLHHAFSFAFSQY